MRRILQWFKVKTTTFILGIIGFLVIAMFAEALGVAHVIEPSGGKLAKLFWVSETDRVPIIIGFAILLSPITLMYKIEERFFKPKKKLK